MESLRKKVVIVGAGMSGLSIANILKDKCEVVILEKEATPGGLIRCKNVNGYLYHMVGGHVFNSKRKDVLEWFLNFFNVEQDFKKAIRNATISFNKDRLIGYPIENYLYQLDNDEIKKIICDLLETNRNKDSKYANFEQFLLRKFGRTLYDIYFKPYNEKIWQCDLSQIPINWLEGKLPTPSIEDIICNNICHEQERDMVHSSFFYPKFGGSQFLADTLSKSIDIKYNTEVIGIERKGNEWCINGEHYCDILIYCGNIKMLPKVLLTSHIEKYRQKIIDLKFHGTTSVLTLIDKNPYSWIYLPNSEYKSHRIICTGNFSENNNIDNNLSATVEFTDFVMKEEILENLQKIPFSPKYLDHTYTQYTYPVQNSDTRNFISSFKSDLESDNMYLLGRFAEWEYYNMDAAIGAAIDLSYRINF